MESEIPHFIEKIKTVKELIFKNPIVLITLLYSLYIPGSLPHGTS